MEVNTTARGGLEKENGQALQTVIPHIGNLPLNGRKRVMT